MRGYCRSKRSLQTIPLSAFEKKDFAARAIPRGRKTRNVRNEDRQPVQIAFKADSLSTYQQRSTQHGALAEQRGDAASLGTSEVNRPSNLDLLARAYANMDFLHFLPEPILMGM